MRFLSQPCRRPDVTTDPCSSDDAKRRHAEAEARFLAGVEFLERGDMESAERCFREALSFSDALAGAAANLGYILDQRGQQETAEAYLRRALELDPHCATAALNLGALLTTAERFKEAEAMCLKAVALRSESPRPWSNLGVLYAGLKREAEAEQCHRTAMALDAGNLAARFNLAYLLLRQGRYEEGWACLEARRWYAAFAARMPCPRWQGEPLAGKSLLIGYEAGHGDMIQFVRYAAVLRERQPRSIDLVCHPALTTLLAGQCGIDRVFGFDETIPDGNWDYWTPPLSIPYHCRTTLETIPARLPYLRAAPERIAAWQPRLPAGGPKVGLVWKGNPRFENDAHRSLPSLATLAPLGGVPGIRFVGLQKGAGEDEALHPPAGLRMTSLGPQLADFTDTAAVVSQLDLVIAVDTAVAHLAGALGVPCWILLPDYQTDWRWLKERTDSPWYPGVVRLFRQTRMGEWGDVVARLSEALAAQTIRHEKNTMP
jgi:Flp pilus assembly protein TadD